LFVFYLFIYLLGTDISCTQENLYRVTRALFPPNLSVLKQICWRGYIDGLKFLQTRSIKLYFLFLILINQKKNSLDLIRSSHLNSKATISSVLGREYTEPANEDEKQLRNGGIVQNVNRIYEDLHDIERESTDDEYSSEESDDESEKENSQVTFSPFCEKVTRKKELPTPLFAGKNFLFV
jgi:hypothetical protein